MAGLQRLTVCVLSVVLSALATLVGCGQRDLRGTFEKSADGGTYLSVEDDNGGGCGPILLDGKPWPHPLGRAASVSAGRHLLSCGGEVAVDVTAGTTFHFNYWGP